MMMVWHAARLKNSFINYVEDHRKKGQYVFDFKFCFCFSNTNGPSLMPYPCSHFYFDIKFGDRLYSKEKRGAWPVLF